MSEGSGTGYLRRLGLFDATMVVIGGIIGAGIFVNPASVAKRTDGNLEIIAVWSVGGLLALAGALAYAELGARRPQAGGGYLYLREAYGPLIAFVYGWIMLLVNYTGSIATVATTFARYFCPMLGLEQSAVPVGAAVAIIVLAVINLFGIRAGSLVQNVFTTLKIAAIIALVVAGLAFAGVAPGPTVPPPAVASNFGSALLPALFAYSGWFYINNIAAEIRQPQRNIPRALTFGMLGCAACYILANVAYLKVLGHDGLAASTAPAADVMERAFGPIGAKAIAAGIAFSTFGFCNISILSSARMFQVMGADGMFFRATARLHPRWHTPDVALFAVAVWAAILALSGTFDQLLNYSTIGDWIGSAMVVAALFWYRRNDTQPAFFLTPGHPWVSLAYVAAVLFIVVSTALAQPRDTLIGLGIIVAGVPVYYAWRAGRKA